MWLAEHVLAVPLSPKVHLQVGVPRPPVVGAVEPTATLTSVGLGVATAVTVNLALTVTEMLDDAVLLAESATVTVTLNVPVEL